MTHKPDIQVDLDREHKKWIALFCDPATDPKDIIKKACGYAEVGYAKMAMNETINGSSQYPEYREWMKNQFPLLYDIWQQTKVKETGINIARHYEQKLMLHPALIAKATELGIVKIIPEHDGVGVFADANDVDLPSKLASLADYITCTSVELFGVPIIIKTKFVFNWGSSDLKQAMEHHRSELNKEYDLLKYHMDRLRKKCFATKDPKDWEKYNAMQKREGEIIARYKPVIEFWSEHKNELN